MSIFSQWSSTSTTKTSMDRSPRRPTSTCPTAPRSPPPSTPTCKLSYLYDIILWKAIHLTKWRREMLGRNPMGWSPRCQIHPEFPFFTSFRSRSCRLSKYKKIPMPTYKWSSCAGGTTTSPLPSTTWTSSSSTLTKHRSRSWMGPQVEFCWSVQFPVLSL